MHEDAPSMAATWLPELDMNAAVTLVDQAMRQRRYVRHDTPLPSGYHAHEGEWMGILLRPVPPGDTVSGTLAIPSDVGLAFKVSTWLSAADPDRLLIAWRRFQGFESVSKYLFDGKPHWKHGSDKDMEVGWHVPSEPPVTLRLPSHSDGFPFDALAAQRLFDDTARAFPTGTDAEPNERLMRYVLRSSGLRQR